MAVTNAFYEAVNTGNVCGVRIMMKDSLLADPSFKEFKEMEKAADSMQGLYDAHDGKEFIEDKSKWNDEYMSRLRVQVIRNFSHERLEHLKKVTRYLYPVESIVKEESVSQASADRPKKSKKLSYEEQKYLDQQEGRYIGSKIAAGAVAGAVIGGVVATVADIAVIGGTAVGAAVGGVVTYAIVNGGH